MSETKTGTESSDYGRDQAEERSTKVDDRAWWSYGGEQGQGSRRVRRAHVSCGLLSREIEWELLEPQRRREEEGGRRYI